MCKGKLIVFSAALLYPLSSGNNKLISFATTYKTNITKTFFWCVLYLYLVRACTRAHLYPHECSVQLYCSSSRPSLRLPQCPRTRDNLIVHKRFNFAIRRTNTLFSKKCFKSSWSNGRKLKNGCKKLYLWQHSSQTQTAGTLGILWLCLWEKVLLRFCSKHKHQ